jgi:hypothetical protein
MLRDLRCATFVDAPGTFNALPWPLRVIFFRQDTSLPTDGLPSKAERSGHPEEPGSFSP